MLTQTLGRQPSRSDGLLVIGHRGAAGLAPENTLAGFAAAVACGVDAVELDVHLTADGRLAVIHDERLDRTTDGSGPVAAMTFKALRRLDAGAGERVPALEDVLDALPPRVAVNVELKGKGTAAAAARALAALDRPIVVSAFDHAELARFHALCPATPCAPLFGRWRQGALDVARAVDAASVNVADRIAETAIAPIRRAGFECLVYTVNDPARARALRDLGVAGVFTDFPDRMLGER